MINESLRLTVISSFAARYSEKDITVGGYLVPAGTIILMALGVSLKNETIWKSVERYYIHVCIQHNKRVRIRGDNNIFLQQLLFILLAIIII